MYHPPTLIKIQKQDAISTKITIIIMNRASTPFQTNNTNHTNQPEQGKLKQP